MRSASVVDDAVISLSRVRISLKSGRRAGFCAQHSCISSVSLLLIDSGVGSGRRLSFFTPATMSAPLSDGYARDPWYISQRLIPKAYTSDALDAPRPSSTSGAMYRTVPAPEAAAAALPS